MVNNIQQKANPALSLAISNSKVIAENTERISSQQQRQHKLLKLKIKRSQMSQKNLRIEESWDQTKLILANEIVNVMPELGKDFITSKIQRAHKAKRNKYVTILPKIAEIFRIDFSEQKISSSAYGQIPRGISLYIVCRILDWLSSVLWSHLGQIPNFKKIDPGQP